MVVAAHWLIILLVAVVMVGLVTWLVRAVRRPARRLDRIEERLAAIEQSLGGRDQAP